MRLDVRITMFALVFLVAGCASVTRSPDGVVAQEDTRSDAEKEPYDPWERFNDAMFKFNYGLDKHVLKPVARGYRGVFPEQLQIMFDNAFHNITWPARFVNSLLQGQFEGALREVSRFVVNSTLGFGGLFDAGKVAGLEPSQRDFGQTLGVWGVPTGPYLVLPLLVRRPCATASARAWTAR